VDLSEADVVRLDIDDEGDIHENMYVNVQNLYTAPKLIFLAVLVLSMLWCTIYTIEVLTPVEARSHGERGYERTVNAVVELGVDEKALIGRLTPNPKIEPSHGEAALRLEMRRIDSGAAIGTSCTEPSPRSSVDSNSISHRHLLHQEDSSEFRGGLQGGVSGDEWGQMGRAEAGGTSSGGGGEGLGGAATSYDVARHVSTPPLQASMAGGESPSQRANRHPPQMHSIDFLQDFTVEDGGSPVMTPKKKV